MVSKDLDKLMGKLKKKEEKPKEDPEKDEFADDLKDDVEDPKEDPEKKGDVPNADLELIENEVAVLQNDGVFRRELLLVLKELVDVQKVQTQTFLDIKKKLMED